jgi:hypothetical protein
MYFNKINITMIQNKMKIFKETNLKTSFWKYYDNVGLYFLFKLSVLTCKALFLRNHVFLSWDPQHWIPLQMIYTTSVDCEKQLKIVLPYSIVK